MVLKNVSWGDFPLNPKVNQQQTTLDIDNTQTFASLSLCFTFFTLWSWFTLLRSWWCQDGLRIPCVGVSCCHCPPESLVPGVSQSEASIRVTWPLWTNQRPGCPLLIRPRHCTHHHHPSQPQWRILSDSLARGLCQSSKHSCKECFLSIFTFKDGITAIR